MIRNRALDIDSRRCEYGLEDHSRKPLLLEQGRQDWFEKITVVFWQVGRPTILLENRLKISCFKSMYQLSHDIFFAQR